MARANLAGRVPAEDARLRPRNSAPSGTATGEHGFDDVSPDVRIIGPTRVRAGWGFVSSYALSFAGNALVFIAPLLVTLALKVDDLVGFTPRRRTWHS